MDQETTLFCCDICNFLKNNMGYIISALSLIITFVSIILTSNRAKEANRITEKLSVGNFINEEKKKIKDKQIQDICKYLELSSPHKMIEFYQNGTVIGGPETPVKFQNTTTAYITELSVLYHRIFMQIENDDKSYLDSMNGVLRYTTDICLKLVRVKISNFETVTLNPNMTVDELKSIHQNSKSENAADKIISVMAEHQKAYTKLLAKSKVYVKKLNEDYFTFLKDERAAKK